MKKYKVIGVGRNSEETEKILNNSAEEGWILVCSYAKHNRFLILSKKKKVLDEE